ncbi:MAG TPA: SBBP repeat-containing protein [Terriglobales bacterium]
MPARISTYGQLPLFFEPNQGQSAPAVKFLARGSGYGIFITGDETVLTTQRAGTGSLMRMSLVGAAQGPVAGMGELPGKSNYLVGKDPAKWRRGIPQFARVRQSGVYRGVDLVYYGKQGRLEYDFEVAPGADPRLIVLQFDGIEGTKLEANGDLALGTDGQLRLESPLIYQTIGNEKRRVAGRFVLKGKNQVGFELGPYDETRALVIDPVFTYSTYLGGVGAETSPSIAVDSTLSAYIAGTTSSADFPIPTGNTPFQSCLNNPACGGGSSDVFVAKLDPAGSTLLFATYLGGTGDDVNAGIAVDTGLSIIVAGRTASPDFPTANALLATASGNHGFVSKLDLNGENLLYSTYLGGTGTDAVTGVALDVKNKIYVTGTTTSTDFPTTAEAFQTSSRGNTQFFISKIDPATSGAQSLPYSTYFGGGNPVAGVAVGGGIAVDKNSNVYITGTTNFLNTGNNASTDFPILNAVEGCLGTPVTGASCPTGVTATDAFVAKLNPAGAVGTQLIYSTYIGGAGNDTGTGIALDSSANAYLTGSTTSADLPSLPLPTSPVGFQPAISCSTAANPCPASDAFVTKLSSFTTGTTTTPTVTILYFSYLGGTGNDSGTAIAVDTLSGARLTGTTASGDFNLSNPISGQGSFRGGATDAFVARLDTTTATSPVHFSSYLGGGGADHGTGIAVDASGASYVTGDTTSGNFPLQNAAQTGLNGSSDAFVSKLGGAVSLTLTGTASPNPAGAGNAVSFKYTITNNGDFTSGITFTDTPTGGSSPSATGPGGACTGTTTLTCPVGALNPGATATVTVSLTPTDSGPFTNNATLSVAGSSFTTSASPAPSVTVSAYALAVDPPSRTVVAGTAATYDVTVTPTGNFPNSVTLSCSGQPTGVTCTVPNGATITNLKNTSPQKRTFVINTQARVTTTSELRHGGLFYALSLPVFGIAFLGLGIGATASRRRRALLALVFGGVLALLLFLPACGSSSGTNSTTTGTPAGTYTVTITASSGSFTRSQPVQLVVQ